MNTKALEILQLEENRQMCVALVEAGDKSDISRIVIHKLEFISEYKKSDLLESLEEKGFTIGARFVTEEGYNGLMFERADKTQNDVIEVLTLELISLLDEHDAHYGGWTTEVIK